MVAFTAYIIVIMRFAAYVPCLCIPVNAPEFTPCSCGGILSDMNWNQHLIFNIVFTMIALTGLIAEEFLKSPQFVQTKRLAL